jgi:hypothetical protein
VAPKTLDFRNPLSFLFVLGLTPKLNLFGRGLDAKNGFQTIGLMLNVPPESRGATGYLRYATIEPLAPRDSGGVNLDFTSISFTFGVETKNKQFGVPNAGNNLLFFEQQLYWRLP